MVPLAISFVPYKGMNKRNERMNGGMKKIEGRGQTDGWMDG